MELTRGETAGGWVHIHKGTMAVALVQPKYVDKFMACDDMYEALKEMLYDEVIGTQAIELAEQALAKAEGRTK